MASACASVITSLPRAQVTRPPQSRRLRFRELDGAFQISNSFTVGYQFQKRVHCFFFTADPLLVSALLRSVLDRCLRGARRLDSPAKIQYSSSTSYRALQNFVAWSPRRSDVAMMSSVAPLATAKLGFSTQRLRSLRSSERRLLSAATAGDSLSCCRETRSLRSGVLLLPSECLFSAVRLHLVRRLP